MGKIFYQKASVYDFPFASYVPACHLLTFIMEENVFDLNKSLKNFSEYSQLLFLSLTHLQLHPH